MKRSGHYNHVITVSYFWSFSYGTILRIVPNSKLFSVPLAWRKDITIFGGMPYIPHTLTPTENRLLAWLALLIQLQFCFKCSDRFAVTVVGRGGCVLLQKST